MTESVILCGQSSEHKGEPPRDGRCPRCGDELVEGYGLCGGGIGTYWLCGAEQCDYIFKPNPEDEP